MRALRGPAPSRPDAEVHAGANVLVRRLASLAPLSEGDRMALQRAVAGSQRVDAHVTLIRDGERPDAAIVIVGGFAVVSKVRVNGQRQILSYLLPGDLHDIDLDLIGCSDILVETVSPCRIAFLRFADIHKLQQSRPVARALRLSKLSAEAMMRERMVGLGSRSALERTASLLCELLFRLRAVGLATDNGCELPMTQTDLADTLGLSTVHMNRVLQALRHDKLIKLRGKRLVVIDMRRFLALAEFQPVILHPGASPVLVPLEAVSQGFTAADGRGTRALAW